MAYRCRNDEYWTFLFVSDGCAELTGYKKEDLLFNRTISYDSVVHPDDRQLVRDAVEAGLSRDRPFEMIYRIVRADDSIRWVQERGQRVQVAGYDEPLLEGLITDVTTQKLAEAELRAQNDRERLLFRDLIIASATTSPRSYHRGCQPGRGPGRRFVRRCRGRAQSGHSPSYTSSSHTLAGPPWNSVASYARVEPADRRGRLDVLGDVEYIAPRQTTALGMVIHELMTNSVKYGALGVERGRVRIDWRPIATDQDDRRTLEIAWHEQGRSPDRE
jgi:PAS domain S-box-containing protein